MISNAMKLKKLIKNLLNFITVSVTKTVNYFYQIIIKPRSANEDIFRRELILNFILLILFVLSCIGCVLIISTQIAEGINYSGVGLLQLTLITLGITFLYYLSRKGNIALPSYSLIILLFALATYYGYRYGVDLPSSLLCFSLLIVISSILISTRFSFLMTLLITSIVLSFSYLEIYYSFIPDRTWQLTNFKIDDAIEYSIILLLIMAVSFLSNKQLEKSLERARGSEKSLQQERDLLEIRVEERTRQIKYIQLEKMTEMYRFVEFGRLASGLFHDLMSPLTAISFALQEYKNNEELSTNTKIALRSSERMQKLLHQAKKHISIPDTQENFNLSNEINLVIDFLSSKWKKLGIEIKLKCKGDEVIFANPVTFSHVMTNLISNAIDSYEFKSLDNLNKKVLIQINEHVEKYIIEVKDFGTGIPQEIIPLIFEPFYTTKNTKGTGIGLSATKHVIEKYFNGTISVLSQVNHGSIFKIEFPK